MLGGAVGGALLVLHGHSGLALLSAGLLNLLVILIVSTALRFGAGGWDRPPG
jgi:hypothetical protein